MSSASIRDVRDAVDLNAQYTFDRATLGVDVGRSSENDYTSDFFNLDGRLDLNQKLTTLATGFSYASDQVWAISHGDQRQSLRVESVGGDKSTYQGLLGLTQVLSRNALMQANLTYTHGSGYLSDPYKFVETLFMPFVVTDGYAGFIRDNRPGNRDQFAVLLRYIHNVGPLNEAAVHLDYRYYADTWGIHSQTFEVAWYQPVYAGWQLVPRVRYYTQTGADFYQLYFDEARADGYYSSDYRMANFGAVSGGAALSKTFVDKLKLAASIDFYDRQKSYGMYPGKGSSIDDFSYSVFSVSAQLRF